MLKKLTLLVALTLAVQSTAFAAEGGKPMVYAGVASKPADTRQAEIASLFDRWNAALATGNPGKVTSLYAPDAVLEPTVSNHVRTTPDEIRSYFTSFLKMKPQGTVNYRQIRLLDDNTALDTGVYTFDLTKNGKPTKVQARYTYVYEKIDGEWKIINHHSSAMPEAVN
ncbi:SgcJ/EcaC family oxidoreductase [Burkholderia pyrrocinia]|uniref:SgcJ/EcaC family oxidoreductase n=1 Tax=Burkholderia pyrrocinia TaxID=60550 RepID=UPI0030CC57A9